MSHVRTNGHYKNSERVVTHASPMTPPEAIENRNILQSLTVFVVVLVMMIRFIHDYPLVWDEGMTLERIDALQTGWVEYQQGGLTWGQFIDRDWRFSRAEPDGHGPFYALWSMAWAPMGRMLFDRPASDRWGSALLFAATCAAVYGTLRRRAAFWAALPGVFFLATTPRLLPEVSFALIDGPLVCLALWAWCFFVRATSTGSLMTAVGFGATIGLAMSTKLTGWFLPIPYLAWLLFEYRSPMIHRWILQGAIAIVTSLVVLFAINVGWWHDPVGGLIGYFQSNLTRAETRPIPVLFLGTRYDFSLPWYNTIVWTFVAMPIGIVLLGLLPVARAFKYRLADPFGRLLTFNWLLLMIVRALPNAPGHDGTRQIAISFAFLAVMAGWSVEYLRRRLTQWDAGRWAGMMLLGLMMGSAMVESFRAVRHYHPFGLSYYSPLIGGLPGADRLGFEPTYFWDSLTPEALAWINDHTDAGRSVLFRNNTPSFRYLREWGKLTVPVALMEPDAGPPQWLVMQNRPGMFTDADRWLFANQEPAFRVSLDGVTLLAIFPIEAWLEAQSHRAPP